MSILIDYYSQLSQEELFYQELSCKGESSPLALRLPESVEAAARRRERIILPSSAYLSEGRDIFISKHPCFMPPYMHTHDFCELSFILRGRAEEEIEGEELSLESGSVLILTPGYYHKVSVFDSSTIALNVLCSTALLFSVSQSLGSDELTKGYTIFSRLTAEAESCLERIFLEQMSWTGESHAVENALFTLLISLLIRSGERGMHQERAGESGTVYKVLAYIDENFRSVTLKEISRRFGLTEQHLSRLIAAKSGTGFSEYIRKAKLREARRLLLTSDMDSKEIAYTLSFTPEHFIRFFRSETGTTPQEYRRLYSR